MPKLGPWKLEDEFGAAASTSIAKRSMDPGVMEAMVQFETMRKIKTVFVKLYQASVGNESMMFIGGKDGKKQPIMGVW
jgi:hypothetical protein